MAIPRTPLWSRRDYLYPIAGNIARTKYLSKKTGASEMVPKRLLRYIVLLRGAPGLRGLCHLIDDLADRIELQVGMHLLELVDCIAGGHPLAHLPEGFADEIIAERLLIDQLALLQKSIG